MSVSVPFAGPASVIGAARRPPLSRRLAFAILATLLLVIAGAAWSGATYFDSINRLSRGTDPGRVEFAASSGRFVVYYEGAAAASLRELDVVVTGPDGQRVRLEPFPYDLRYDVGKLVGHAVAVFEAPLPGNYVVTATLGEEGAAGRLAVGADLGASTVLLVVAMIAALFALGLGVLLALVVLVTRPRRRGWSPSPGTTPTN